MFLGQAIPAAAQFVPEVPEGLEVGDEFRIGGFVSEEFFTDALSDDIDFYNAIAQMQGEAIEEILGDSYMGTDIFENPDFSWQAIVSTDAVDARDNTGTADTTEGAVGNVEIYRLDQELIANDNDQLWSGTLENSFNISVLDGGVLNGRASWTGTASDGTASNCALGTDACRGLSTRGNSFFSGQIDGTEGFWTDDTLNVQSKEQGIYILSDVITVEMVKDMPEPGTVISLVTLGGIFLGTSRRKKSTKK